MRLARLGVILLVCIGLAGCALPLLVVPVAGTGLLAVASAYLFGVTIRGGSEYQQIYPLVLYTALITAVLWIMTADKLAAWLEAKRGQEVTAPDNLYLSAMELSLAAAAAVLLVLWITNGLVVDLATATQAFMFSFGYVLLIALPAKLLQQRGKQLRHRINALASEFPQRAINFSGIAAYGTYLEGMHKVQGAGYFAFFVPVLVLFGLLAVDVAISVDVMQLLGLGMLVFAATAVAYVAWRSVALARSTDFSFDQQVDYDRVLALYGATYDARMAVLHDRAHTMLVVAASLLLGIHLYLSSPVNWVNAGAQAAAVAAALMFLFCWLPFFVHQSATKQHLEEQLTRHPGNTPERIRVALQALDSDYPSLPKVHIFEDLSSILAVGGLVAVLTTLGQWLS